MIEFIPLAHEQEVLRRVPLATFTIMGICAALLLVSWIAEPTDADCKAFLTAATNAVEYWRGRPYLVPSPTLDEVLRFLPDSEHEQVMWLMKPSPEHEASLELAYLEQENLDSLWSTASDLRPKSLTSLWGRVPARPSAFKSVVSTFLHADFSHLFWNMLFLFVVGPLLEDVWGRSVFAGFFVLAGLVAGLGSAAMKIESTIPACGASGAISALMGAFFVRFWSTKIRVLVCPFWTVPLAEAWVPAWAILSFWFWRDVVHLPLELAGDDFVGHTAHISGFVFGALFAGLLWGTGAERKWLAPVVRARSERAVIRNEDVNRALAAVADERYEEAWDVLWQRLETAPADEDAALALWFVGLEIDRVNEAAPVLARVIEEETRRGQLDVAMEHLDELWAHVPDAAIDPSCLIRLASDLDRRHRRGEAIELLSRVIQTAGSSGPTHTVLRTAVVTARFDPNLAAVAARAALERSDLDPDGKAAAERILDLAARSTVAVSGPAPDPR